MCEESDKEKTEEGGRRRSGRPKLKWMNSIKRDIEKAGMNSREWERMAGDDESIFCLYNTNCFNTMVLLLIK